MSNYTKSHSNFVLKNKHKTINGGTIFERDWTTIGGIDSFAPNQVPIYRSGNFLITVNNDNAPKKDIKKDKWYENQDGDSWNYDYVENVTSNTESQADKIVVKNDYHSLYDFAYYGSCAELVRGSINGILDRFPGELYITNISGWTIGDKDYGESFLVDNPFNIDIYTKYVNLENVEDELKYLAANDFTHNYEIILDGSSGETFSVEITEGEPTCSACTIQLLDDSGQPSETSQNTYQDGDVFCNVVFKNESSGTLFTINVVKYKDKKIYFTNCTTNYHIRPKQKFIDDFFNTLDSFESVILNPNTEPKYKATFEIISENNQGFTKSVQDFIFPIGEGGYNIGSNLNAFKSYLDSFMDISLFYDERFSDNLYRMMTHESIKNFDWTYNIPNENQEEYSEGKAKIDQILRLFGREFDEIKFYIDGIRNYNKITYDDKNNIPDYFLTDEVEIEGWDLKNIYPLKYNKATDECSTPNFSTLLYERIQPYADRLIYPNGYFNTCTSGCVIDESNTHYLLEKITYDNGIEKSFLRKKNKKFSSQKEYTYKDANKLFLKHLKLNSREILKHKGTIEGIEMMLGLFGLKSKRYVEENTNSNGYSCSEDCSINASCKEYDFDIKEYVTVTNGIVDKYWECKDMTRIDWYNKTKTIQYNNNDFKQGIYHHYQGLPVSYREIENENEKYNIIYPYFNSKSEIDGNLYYQMDGGWITSSPYTFDKNNNLVNGFDLYNETLNSIRIVDTPLDLIKIASSELDNGQILKVNDLSGQYIIIDGYIYKIEKDFNGYEYITVKMINNLLTIGNNSYEYDFYTYDPYGSCLVNDSENRIKHYNLMLLNNNEEIKIFIIDNEIHVSSNSERIDDFEEVLYVNAGVFNSNSNFDKSSASNYFKILNKYNKNQFNKLFQGWVQLPLVEKPNADGVYKDLFNEYKKVNTITNYFKGNNPHSGKNHYDGGFKYINYFANLFNYSYNNEYFDIRPYQGEYEKELVNIGNIGFKNLISDELNKKYPLYNDSKIHYFGDTYNLDYSAKDADDNPQDFVLDEENKVKKEEELKYKIDDITSWYDYETDYKPIFDNFVNTMLFDVSDEDLTKDYFKASSTIEDVCYDAKIDGCTDQILNTKNILLRFVLRATANDMEEKNDVYISELKYFQDVVMNYVTQMIPPTVILRVEYICSGNDEPCNVDDDFNTSSCKLKLEETTD